MLNYILIGILGSILASISQLILKNGAVKKKNNSKLVFFINSYTIIGYGLFLIVTLINLYIFKYLDIKYSLIFLPTTFILVQLLSLIFLKERLKKKYVFGFVIILLGIIIFNL